MILVCVCRGGVYFLELGHAKGFCSTAPEGSNKDDNSPYHSLPQALLYQRWPF